MHKNKRNRRRLRNNKLAKTWSSKKISFFWEGEKDEQKNVNKIIKNDCTAACNWENYENIKEQKNIFCPIFSPRFGLILLYGFALIIGSNNFLDLY